MVLVDYTKQRANVSNNASKGKLSSSPGKARDNATRTSNASFSSLTSNAFIDSEQTNNRLAEILDNQGQSISFCMRQSSFRARKSPQETSNISSTDRLHQSLLDFSTNNDNGISSSTNVAKEEASSGIDRRMQFARLKPKSYRSSRSLSYSRSLLKSQQSQEEASLTSNDEVQSSPSNNNTSRPNITKINFHSLRNLLLTHTAPSRSNNTPYKNKSMSDLWANDDSVSESEDDVESSRPTTKQKYKYPLSRSGSHRNLFVVDTSIGLATTAATVAAVKPVLTRRGSRRKMIVDSSTNGVDTDADADDASTATASAPSQSRPSLSRLGPGSAASSSCTKSSSPVHQRPTLARVRSNSSRRSLMLQSTTTDSSDVDAQSTSNGRIYRRLHARSNSQRNLMINSEASNGSKTNDASHFVTGSRIRRHGSSRSLQGLMSTAAA